MNPRSDSNGGIVLGPKHPVTGVPMRRCPTCDKWSGLTGIDGKNCLACTISTGTKEPKRA